MSIWTWWKQRRYDRQRNMKTKPVSAWRIRHMWVVDQDDRDSVTKR